MSRLSVIHDIVARTVSGMLTVSVAWAPGRLLRRPFDLPELSKMTTREDPCAGARVTAIHMTFGCNLSCQGATHPFKGDASDIV